MHETRFGINSNTQSVRVYRLSVSCTLPPNISNANAVAEICTFRMRRRSTTMTLGGQLQRAGEYDLFMELCTAAAIDVTSNCIKDQILFKKDQLRLLR